MINDRREFQALIVRSFPEHELWMELELEFNIRYLDQLPGENPNYKLRVHSLVGLFIDTNNTTKLIECLKKIRSEDDIFLANLDRTLRPSNVISPVYKARKILEYLTKGKHQLAFSQISDFGRDYRVSMGMRENSNTLTAKFNNSYRDYLERFIKDAESPLSSDRIAPLNIDEYSGTPEEIILEAHLLILSMLHSLNTEAA